MTPVDYLIAAFVAIMALGTCTLVAQIRRAVEAFEDAWGFHFGAAPAVTALFLTPAHSATGYVPAESPRASVPAPGKRRRKSGSKPPLLPPDLQAADLKPRSQSVRPSTSTDTSSPASGQTHISFPDNSAAG